MPLRSSLPGLVLLGALAAPGVARAQFASVVAPPPRPAAPPVVASADSAPGRLPSARDSLEERQRLDIQAWVDSAAPALARTAPAARDDAPPPAVSPRPGAPSRPAPVAPPPGTPAPSRAEPAPRRPTP